MDRGMCQLFNFTFPFIHQDNGNIGCSDPVGPERGVLYDDGTQVAVVHFFVYAADLVATPNDQALAREQIAFWV